MKQLFIILTAVLLTVNVLAQTPESLSYQAVIRNSSDALITNTQLGMQISILQGSASGTAVYVETQTPTSNANGLVSIEIGTGTSSDDFSAIDWANGTYFIKTETDLEGGTSYTITGVSQLLSVPYALHAKTAESVANIEITGDETAFDGWDKDATDDFDGDYNNLTNTPTIPTVPTNVSAFTNDAGYVTENTQLTEGQVDNYVANNGYLTAEVDGSVTNEIQDLDEVLTQSNDANAQQIKNLADPTEAQDATTKAYVDALLARIETLELLNEGFIDERDGNHYNAVKIGNQVWMAENLKYLPSVVGPGTGSQTDSYYYVYGYDGTDVATAKQEANYQTYGVLYNWSAAMSGASSSNANPSGVQGVCPDGWHLPSDTEWKELEMALGMSQSDADATGWRGTNEGSKLAGNADLWNDGDLESDIEFGSSGFSALPGGYRNNSGSFVSIGGTGIWWSATEGGSSNAWYRYLNYDYSDVGRINFYKENGFSVRCVKD